MKNPVTTDGIEPATFRFVAQRLNHCAHRGPPEYVIPIAFPPQQGLYEHVSMLRHTYTDSVIA